MVTGASNLEIRLSNDEDHDCKVDGFWNQLKKVYLLLETSLIESFPAIRGASKQAQNISVPFLVHGARYINHRI